MSTYPRALDWSEQYRAPDQRAARDMNYVNGEGQGFPPMGSQGGPPMSPPRETPAGSAPFARLIFPPRIEKLPTSADFYAADFLVAIPAVVNSVTVSALLSFTLPETMVGFLQQFSIYVLNSLATTRLQWTVRINQGPVSGFDRILNPPGAANLVMIFTNDMRIRVTNHATVDVAITNLDGAAVTAGGSIAGWYHPLADEIRMFGPEGTG
jgi:hypothetical protein